VSHRENISNRKKGRNVREVVLGRGHHVVRKGGHGLSGMLAARCSAWWVVLSTFACSEMDG
jgi:hypothetical protein